MVENTGPRKLSSLPAAGMDIPKIVVNEQPKQLYDKHMIKIIHYKLI